MPIFALVDCNNFFVSCERAVDPSLVGKPVVVLSNNDGCIVSRSEEAKGLGIRMGEPYFKIRAELARQRVQVFSSNFALYNAKSEQIINILTRFSPQLERYSIDEAFLQLQNVPISSLRAYAAEMKATVLRETGVPVSIGIAETKTLAKLANGIAKKAPRLQGILNLYRSSQLDMALSRIPVEQVWGVGRRLSHSLQAAKIFTARDLRDTDDKWILRRYNIVLLKTVLELRGTSCFPIRDTVPPRKSIMYSRSFGNLIETQSQMEEAISTFTARAAEKLREDKLVARHLGVYIRTSRFIPPEARFRNYGEVFFHSPTDCTSDLIREALAIIRRIFREGYAYYKAMITLNEVSPATERQMGLFETRDVNRLQTLMHTLDRINRTFGNGTLQYAAEGFEKPWVSKRQNVSQHPQQPGLQLPETRDERRRAVIGFVHPIHG
jgi:DNA polymerase V